jgi:hypothetical protein
MSSLTEKSVTFVPVFEGFGYGLWAEKVRHFAMMNGFIDAFDELKKPLKPAKPEDDTDFFRGDRRKYHEMQQKAMGLILSRVFPTIAEALNHEFKVSTKKKITYASITAVPNANTKSLSVVSGRALNTTAVTGACTAHERQARDMSNATCAEADLCPKPEVSRSLTMYR